MDVIECLKIFAMIDYCLLKVLCRLSSCVLTIAGIRNAKGDWAHEYLAHVDLSITLSGLSQRRTGLKGAQYERRPLPIRRTEAINSRAVIPDPRLAKYQGDPHSA